MSEQSELELEVNPLEIGDEGMKLGDRCRFCGEFYDKAKPFICPGCWENVKAVVAEYHKELA